MFVVRLIYWHPCSTQGLSTLRVVLIKSYVIEELQSWGLWHPFVIFSSAFWLIMPLTMPVLAAPVTCFVAFSCVHSIGVAWTFDWRGGSISITWRIKRTSVQEPEYWVQIMYFILPSWRFVVVRTCEKLFFSFGCGCVGFTVMIEHWVQFVYFRFIVQTYCIDVLRERVEQHIFRLRETCPTVSWLIGMRIRKSVHYFDIKVTMNISNLLPSDKKNIFHCHEHIKFQYYTSHSTNRLIQWMLVSSLRFSNSCGRNSGKQSVIHGPWQPLLFSETGHESFVFWMSKAMAVRHWTTASATLTLVSDCQIG